MNQKRKGNNNERKCAKVLSEWTGIKMTKVPASGGMRLKDASMMLMDLMAEEQVSQNPADDNYMPFGWETKHLKKIHFCTPLPEKSQVRNIWKGAVEDAERGNRIPICLLRENGMPEGEFVFIIGRKYFHTPDFSQFLEPEFVSGVMTDDFVGYNSKLFFQIFTYKEFCNGIKQPGPISSDHK